MNFDTSYKEHQDLLWKAAMDELNKEKKQHKIDYHTTNMFPTSGAAPNEATWVKEMSEGMNESVEDEENDNENEDKESPEEAEEESKSFKLKTKKQRRKELKLKMKEKRKNYDKREKCLNIPWVI